ncbi:MAG: MFS transporter [Porticoccaceae bacterium]|nr:MFS transporter [Porticoccaceae bacterium]
MYYGWILLSTIGFIYMASVGAVFYGLSVMMPAMIDDLGWTRAQATTGFAILSVVIGVAGPLVTIMMKKINPRLTIILGGFVTTAGASIVYFNHSLPVYYLATAVLGCGMTMQAVLPGTQLVTLWFHQRRSMALGIFMAAGGLGGVVGAPTFTWLIHWFNDWRPVWLFVGLVSLFSSLLSWLLIRNKPEDVGQQLDGVNTEDSVNDQPKAAAKAGVYKTNRDWTVRQAFMDSTYWIILFSGALAVTGHMMVSSQLVLHVKDMGMTAIIAASALGVQGLFTTSGRFLSGLLGDFTIEPRTLFFFGMASEFIGMLILTNAHNPILLYASVIFFGLGFGLGLVGSTAMLANYYGPENTPTLLSYRILLSTVFGGIGVVIAGYCGDIFGGYKEVFYGFSGFLLLATLLVLLIKIPKPETSELAV